MYLFFDTETVGLPRNWKAPVTDLNNWPRLVQLAYLVYDGTGNLLASKNSIIRPEGFTIPTDASRIHGITTEIAQARGISLASVLSDFQSHFTTCSHLVAHNMSFDEKIVGAEFLRCGLPNTIPAKKRICTMQATTDFCGIPGMYGNKWPKLSELHYKLFKEDFDEAHNAAVDIQITAKCFWELMRVGVLKPQNV
jgi:DNA polymerase III subunit epsilon